MALSGEDHEVLDAKLARLESNLTQIIELQVKPINKRLSEHIGHDEKHDREVDLKLDKLCSGQTKLYAFVTMGAFICAPVISYALGKI